jgi:hypothetical protein
MVKVCILQADNRPSLYYLQLTKEVNKFFSHYLGYEYLFLEIHINENENVHPAIKKIDIVNNLIQESKYDILIFLDSDAWVHNCFFLVDLMKYLLKNDKKHGCFSRDPYLKNATYINSGSFILKINDYTKKMYSDIIKDLNNNSEYHNCWPYDQIYISNYIFENKDDFYIFIPELLNTPNGEILRHNWYKNKKMNDDLIDLIESINRNEFCIIENPIEIEKYLDNHCYPNTEENETA